MKKSRNTLYAARKNSQFSNHKMITFIYFSFCICVCAALLITQIILPKLQNKISVQSNSYRLSSAPTVIIDPGHGGRDPGKVGTVGTLEKELNLKIALHLKNILDSQGIEVILTRTKDKDLATTTDNFKFSDMKERVSLIQKSNADLVVSIHQNSYTDPNVYGAQCFYYTNAEEGKKLASLLQKQIITSTNQTKLRDPKENSDYYLLKHSPSPIVIVECGFLSNPKEEQLLLTDEYQRKMAWAIQLGILQYLNQNKNGF